MPSRMIKESLLTSEKFNSLNWFEQTTYIRMILIADDFGRFDGREAIIKSYCFPLDEKITRSAIHNAISKMVNVGLLQKYEVNDKPYLMFPNFGKHQRLRSKTSKCPAPPNNSESKDDGYMTDTCQTHDRHMTDTCQTYDSHMTDTCQLEEEVEVELEEELEDEVEVEKKNASKSKRKKKNGADAIVSILDEIQDDDLKIALENFVEARKKMRRPLTGYAFKLAYNKLQELSTDVNEQTEIVNQAISKGWMSFYPLKKDDNAYQNGNFSLPFGDSQ